MEPIRIDPARALDEAMRAQRKLAAGVRTLQQVEDVDYGVTDKEAVYRED
ncbi:MAG: class III poly(R)-hydroxyalkanoic acid synthase subunit PhaC, partial [Proteobacteria bacterium]|nr:class III poly(R)-hydroxyalkanoic acid synthase subunit PhaC [Pseudomonadota bacterium]